MKQSSIMRRRFNIEFSEESFQVSLVHDVLNAYWTINSAGKIVSQLQKKGIPISGVQIRYRPNPNQIQIHLD